MSILPGWARGGGTGRGNILPPWYNQGGSRGPSTNGSGQMPRPMPKPNIPSFGGNGMTPSMGRGGTNGGGTNTAPVNPWLDEESNQPIFSDNIDTSFLDELMRNLQQRGKEEYTPEDVNYKRSGELDESFRKFRDLSETGGYSPEDIANIRARGVSPIKSIYSSANRNLNRQRSLQGGYAPGMGAAISRMARESSEQVGDVMTKTNADIADRVAQGKQTGIAGLGSLSGQENQLMNEFSMRGAERNDRAGFFNADQKKSLMDQLLSLTGMKQNLLQGNKENRLREREGSRAGSLNWEELLQRGGLGLIEAMMRGRRR